MSILKNAIDSIAMGLEDFEAASVDERRTISATRNIFAGILLLFKHRLSELSPLDSDEVLIKQRVLPDIDNTGVLSWVGKGKKTVDVQGIKERFESLNITVDWKRLDSINKYRNDIEHYYSNINTESVQQLLSDSFLIIRDFISDELEQDPKSLLGEDYWKVLVDVNEVYIREKESCNLSLEQLEYFSSEILQALKEYNCDSCGSGLIETQDNDKAVDAIFECKACSNSMPYEEIINPALNNYFTYEVYSTVKDGGELPIIDCPFYCDGIYIFHDQVCATCGDSAVHECSNCCSKIMPEEMTDSSMCGYCSHRYEKLMAE